MKRMKENKEILVKEFPKTKRVRLGYHTSCDDYWGTGNTPRDAFAAWQEAVELGKDQPAIPPPIKEGPRILW